MPSNCTVAPFKLRPNKLTREPGAKARCCSVAALSKPAVVNWSAPIANKKEIAPPSCVSHFQVCPTLLAQSL